MDEVKDSHTTQEESNNSQTVKEKIERLFDETRNILETVDEEDALAFASWVKKKAELRYIEKDKEHPFKIIPNGIYWAYLGINIGSEENKHRPVLIIRSERNARTYGIVPLSTKRLNDGYWYHVDLENYNNTALVEHFRTIDKDRIEEPMRIKGRIAECSKEDVKKIKAEIRRLWGTHYE